MSTGDGVKLVTSSGESSDTGDWGGVRRVSLTGTRMEITGLEIGVVWTECAGTRMTMPLFDVVICCETGDEAGVETESGAARRA